MKKPLRGSRETSDTYSMEHKRPTKRIFMRGPKSVRTSISLTEAASTALERIAVDVDRTVPEVIGDLVEEYLVWLATEGVVTWPEGTEPKKSKKD